MRPRCSRAPAARLHRPVAATLPAMLAALSVVFLPAAGASQQADIEKQIQESQRRLEQIRAERERLESEMKNTQIRIRDASSDLANVERRLSASRSVLAEIQLQVDATSKEVESTTRELLQTRENLSERKAVLERRLRDIYKMGPLHTVQVILGATSFTDLLNRYRYMRRVATFDRALVDRVQELEGALTSQSRELDQRMAELGRLQRMRMGEVAQLRSVEAERQAAVAQYRSRAQTARSRLDQLAQDESRMTGLISDLERRRLEEERRRAAGRGDAGTLTESDEGSLAWPLDGQILYRFGRERRPNGLVLRWNGIGIKAPRGTPVRAVRPGRVVLAGPFEGYGPTVVLSHGNGFYTLYLYLEDVGVVEGRDVAAGQVVGTVGGSDTPEGPHVEFQIRAPVDGGTPQAQDPLKWLRPRGNG